VDQWALSDAIAFDAFRRTEAGQKLSLILQRRILEAAMEAVQASGKEQSQLCGKAAGMLDMSSALDQLAAMHEQPEKPRGFTIDDLNRTYGNPSEDGIG
jgi:hypothetical protein